MGKSRVWKALAVVCSALLCVALVPSASLTELTAAFTGTDARHATIAQAAPSGEGIATEQGETSVTFAQLKEQTADESYRASVNYVAGKVVFAVRDTRLDGAQVQYLEDADAFCRDHGLAEVTFVYESQSKTAQVAVGEIAYDVYYEASIAGDDVWAAIDDLNSCDEVLYAEPDITWENTAVGGYTEATADEVHEAWQLDAVNAKSAWKKAFAAGINPGQGAVVAVIDTGVDYSHIDLVNSMWTNGNETIDGTDNDGDGYVDDVYGVNLVADSGDPMDDQGHGTHVAGIIAAQAGNGGSVGVAYGAQIMAIKAGQSTGTFASSDIAKGIDYARTHGADVINMSFGGTGRSAIVEAALADAFSTCVLVASAGNDGLPTSEASGAGYSRWCEDVYPAGYNYVLGVMSCDGNGDGNLSSFSNWDYASGAGCEYELIAPGENVYSTLPGNRYAKWSGTSMAAPEVSAAAAIVRSLNSDKSKYTSRYIMGQLSSATDKSVSYVDKNRLLHDFAKLDVADAIDEAPTPDLSIIEIYFFDDPSINSKNNGDGIVQPGETIDLGVVVRNQWGIASNVVLDADAVSDGGVASPYITFEQDKVSIQDIGTFAQANNGFTYDDDSVPTGVSNPIRFTVSENVTNDMQLAINLHVTASNGMDKSDASAYTADGQKTFTVQNGQTLHGTLQEDTTLTSDKLWIIDSGLLVPEGITLTVQPGTQIQFWSSDASNLYATDAYPYIAVKGTLNCEGSETSPIRIYTGDGFDDRPICIYRVSQDGNNVYGNYGNASIVMNYCVVDSPGLIHSDFGDNSSKFNITSADHCIFSQKSSESQYFDDSGYWGYVGDATIDSCSNTIVTGFVDGDVGSISVPSFRIKNLKSSLFSDGIEEIRSQDIAATTFLGVARTGTRLSKHSNLTVGGFYPNSIHQSAVLNNFNDYSTESWMGIVAQSGTGTIDVSGNYWGTSDPDMVKKQVEDADSNPSLYDLVQNPFLTLDSSELEAIYPFVTEAYVTDASGNKLSDVASGQDVQLHVKFNRDMDQSVQPTVTYGPAEPYTDYVAYGDWRSAREWVGSIRIGQFIDQGDEFIRVKDAVAADDAWLKTGTDAGRFKFTVSKSAASAMTLQGSAETSGVHLSWKQDDYDTLAGYNVYRSTSYDKETSVSEQDFQKINNAVVSATVGDDGSIATYGAYDDSTVDPVTDYYYYFTVVDTQFNESEPSNVVKATTGAIDLSSAVINVGNQTYTGQNVCPDPYVTLNGTQLQKGTDYTLSFENNKELGKATVTITGKGNYSGQASATFDIVRDAASGSEQTPDTTPTPNQDSGSNPAAISISAGLIEISGPFVYMGLAVEPELVVMVDGNILVAGTDYAVAYSDNEGFGTGRATVTGKGNYAGTLTADFEITSDVVNVFSDANRGDWYVESGALDYAYAHGLISGYSGTDLVGAYDPIKRQDVAVILWRMAGEPEVASGDGFEDVDYGDYYGPAVRWARATGVINGYQDVDGAYRTFGPSDLVTREQLAAMIANYAEKVGGMSVASDCAKLDALPDAGDVSDWARISFAWCMDNDIINGVNENGTAYAQPSGNAWRASMASMAAVLHRDVLKLG